VARRPSPRRLLRAREEGRFTAHGRPPISTTATEISRVYTAHTGDEATRVAHETVSGILMSVAYELETRLPAGTEKDTALHYLREVLLWSREAISLGAIPSL
jgi:hypothetical protein